MKVSITIGLTSPSFILFETHVTKDQKDFYLACNVAKVKVLKEGIQRYKPKRKEKQWGMG